MTLSASILLLVFLGMTIYALVGRSTIMQGATLTTEKKDKASRIREIFSRAKERLGSLRKERRDLTAAVVAKADAVRLAAAKKGLDDVV
jgi:hypothetical protein